MKPYPQYKDSSIDWLGQIPEHWEVKKLKFISSYNDEALPETTEPDEVINYIDISSVNLVDGIEKLKTLNSVNLRLEQEEK